MPFLFRSQQNAVEKDSFSVKIRSNGTNKRKDFVKSETAKKKSDCVGLSNILDSELCRRKPAEGSHR